MILDKKPIDVIITCDWNKSIGVKEIESFFIQIGVFDTYNFINSKEEVKRDATYEYRSKQIDSIAMIVGIL